MIWPKNREESNSFLVALNFCHPASKCIPATSVTLIDYLDLTVYKDKDRQLHTYLFTNPTKSHLILETIHFLLPKITQTQNNRSLEKVPIQDIYKFYTHQTLPDNYHKTNFSSYTVIYQGTPPSRTLIQYSRKLCSIKYNRPALIPKITKPAMHKYMGF